MKKMLLASVFAMSIFTFTSCEKTVLDNAKPTINLVAPAEGEVIKPGSDIHFDAVLTDDVALKSYKINIHGAFDGHSHSAATRTTADAVAFEKTWVEADFIKLGDEPVLGKKQANLHHHHMVIPSEIGGKPVKEGHYHFIIYCTDEAGNESFVAREIEISYSGEEHAHH
ncbi:MAG: DUF4625 domain-containing protein [Bacteroidia bacterium]|nr:DUF4625 domain-containing protein [Bacteroidia bacterium]